MAMLERSDNGVEWAGLYVAHVGMVEPWCLSISGVYADRGVALNSNTRFGRFTG
jgi:hypothetical protein